MENQINIVAASWRQSTKSAEGLHSAGVMRKKTMRDSR